MSVIPDPFSLDDWIAEHEAELSEGKILDLFPGHPDGEFSVQIAGGAEGGEAQQCVVSGSH